MSSKFTVVVTLLLGAWCVGCGSDSEPLTSKATNYEVGEDSLDSTSSSSPDATGDVTRTAPASSTQASSTPAAPRRPEPMNKTVANAPTSPDMVQPTAEQLMSVIRHLRQQEPKGNNEEEVIANFVDLQTKLIQAVDMLLEMKPADEVITEAASAKIGALTAVSQLGSDDAMDQVFAFTEELTKHPSKTVSAFGRQQSFITLLNAFSTGQVDDAQLVIDEFKKLADEQPKEGGMLSFGRDVAGRFTEKGLMQEAAQLLRYTAGLVQPTDDPRLARSAQSLIEQARFAEVDFSGKLNAVAEKKDGAMDAFAAMLGELTSEEEVGGTTLQTLLQVASMLEGMHGEAAGKVYDTLEASIGKVSDPELGEVVRDSIDKYRIRSSIVGKPFELSGVVIDGSPFDWNAYKGKVVLVDFWATWCGPCLQEMPNIRANYEKYRDQGFEVVGVNLDDEMDTLKEFNELQPLPWPSVLSADPTAVGWDHPMVVKNGVAAIPFLVLVNRDGKAMALNTRGEALGEQLAKLFPEAAAESEPASIEKPNAPETPAAKEPAAPEESAAPAKEDDAAPVPPTENSPPIPVAPEPTAGEE